MSQFLTKKYLSDMRIKAYIEQYKYIKDNDNILEVGKGSGVFGDIAGKIASYKSIDIDSSTNSDFVADITKWEEIKDYRDCFNIIFCCQVLEHMPFEDAKKALCNLIKLNAEKLVVSIPDNRRAVKLKLKVPKIDLEHVLTVPFSGKNKNINNNKVHFWEIWHKNEKEVIRIFKNSERYLLKKHYRLYDRPYQHFFILDKRKFKT